MFAINVPMERREIKPVESQIRLNDSLIIEHKTMKQEAANSLLECKFGID